MIQKKIRSLIYAGLGLVLCVLLCGGIGTPILMVIGEPQ